jgi:hypothetical protein
MRTAFLIFFLVGLVPLVHSQQTSSANWAKLAKVTYDKTEDEYGEIYVPKFSADVKSLSGKTIVLEGFIVPFDGLFDPKKIIVSSLPIASCFFCGGSGPETVAEVYLKEAVKYTAKAVRVTGTLYLNDKDYNQLMYVLKDAKMEVL